MSFSLVADSWFPVVLKSGARAWRTFPELAETEGDCPVDFAWPRTDFNTAAFELAIGLATLAFHDRDDEDWPDLWASPPDAAAMRDCIVPFADAFMLDGEGPRFLQDFEPLEGDANPVENLLIDTPGENGQKKNADLLTHRARFPALGLPAAAMALYALQQYAPSGGAGNRTSMRGGGPMTTLVVPLDPDDLPAPLWKTILANLVLDEANRLDPKRDLPRALPWLAPTLLSDKAHGEHELHDVDDEVHPLQAYFGMPRRIRLVIEGEGICPMMGARGPLVTGFVQKPWGVNYGSWVHPLTPYRRQKESDPPLSVKPKSGRFGYRDWVSVTVGRKEAPLAAPAKAVQEARHHRAGRLRGAGAPDPRLRVAGWAMNNMEAMTYLFSEQPLHVSPDAKRAEELDAWAIAFAEAASIVAGQLRSSLRAALFSSGATVDAQKGVFEQARTAFFEATETPFHRALDAIVAGDSPEEQSRRWLQAASRAARAVFDIAAPLPLDDPQKGERIAGGYRLLTLTLAGHGKTGKALFASLGLPLPPARTRPEKEAPVS